MDPRIVDAFAAVRRERHLPPPPWLLIGGAAGRQETSDPVDLYQDVLVALSAEAGINNGEPSLHALCLGAIAPRAGERVVHVGAGGGYYTAILAELVAPGGRVAAYEIEPALASLAREALSDRPSVTVMTRSGAGPLAEADLVYVSAGTPAPAPSWLDALTDGGRLIFPMTPIDGSGGMLLVTRRGARFAARFVSPCRFIPLIGGPDPGASARLARAFAGGGADAVRSLDRGTPDGDDVWFAWAGGYLSRKPVET